MNKKVITYSLLAHINNQIAGKSSFDQIFLPLVKRGLSKMCANGVRKGDDLEEIRRPIEELYGLDMPASILKVILQKVQNEINTPDKTYLRFYSEGSFIIDEYVFSEYEEQIEQREDQLVKLETLFINFASAEGKSVEHASIYEFLEENKVSLGKYIAKKYPRNNIDNTVHARFVNFIKDVPGLYDLLQSVYIGSIISTYLEYSPSNLKSNVELVLDTNFIISLIDLNTSTSTLNCRRLMEISNKMGYKFTVLEITLKEIDGLLKAKIDHFDKSFLSRELDPEDIYNACDRRKMSKTDLERVRTSIVELLNDFAVSIVYHTEKYEKRARFGDLYEKLKEHRTNNFAALHDATCIEYVNEKRGKPIFEYTKVNCWFINNSSSKVRQQHNGVQLVQIKAEDLLNLLWLASPSVKEMLSGEEMGRIGLSRLISTTLDGSLPSSRIIRELDDNIHKYAKENISDEDIVLVSKSIANRTISNIEDLSKLAAEDDKSAFVNKLRIIADNQKHQEEALKNVLIKITSQFEKNNQGLQQERGFIEKERSNLSKTLDGERKKQEEVITINAELAAQNLRLRNKLVENQNSERKVKKLKYIKKKVLLWRLKAAGLLISVIIFAICIVLYAHYINNWSWQETTGWMKTWDRNVVALGVLALLDLIITGILVKNFSDRLSASNTNAYRQNIIIPSHMQEIPPEL
jgi:uncharacterized membrane protein